MTIWGLTLDPLCVLYGFVMTIAIDVAYARYRRKKETDDASRQG